MNFNPASHEYRLDGEVIPSVTTVLSDCGLVGWYPDVEFYKARGSAVHKACAAMIRKRLILDQTDVRLHGYVESFRKFVARTGFTPTLIEEPVYSLAYRTAGTLDYLGDLNNAPTIIDLKSGDPADCAPLQTAAYSYLLKESHGIAAARRMTLRLDPDGKECKSDEHFNYSDDVRVFLSATAVWHWRFFRGLIKK